MMEIYEAIFISKRETKISENRFNQLLTLPCRDLGSASYITGNP